MCWSHYLVSTGLNEKTSKPRKVHDIVITFNLDGKTPYALTWCKQTLHYV